MVTVPMMAIVGLAGACLPAVVLTVMLGVRLGGVLHEMERVAAFLETREVDDNARLTVGFRDRATVRLVQAVNGALDRERAGRLAVFDARRRFDDELASFAHDLRTPLAGAVGYLELYSCEDDPGIRARYLACVQERLATMSDLTDDLFEYAASCALASSAENERTNAKVPVVLADKARDAAGVGGRADVLGRTGTGADDTVGGEVETPPTALLPIVEEALVAQYPVFVEKGWEPRVSFENEGFTVAAEPEVLARIVANLVTNAVRHGSGPVCIGQRGGSVMFANPVPNPGAIDVDRIFDRFWRADPARASVGSGMGLAIVANLCHAIGATVRADLDGNVLVVTVEFPVEFM